MIKPSTKQVAGSLKRYANGYISLKKIRQKIHGESKMKEIKIKIPDQIYKKFKEAVVDNESNLTAELVHFMKQYGDDEMWEMSDGVNTAYFDNLFVGLETMLFHAQKHKKEEGWVKIRSVKVGAAARNHKRSDPQ